VAFLFEDEPPRFVALPVLPGISRLVAPNPSVMTYHGTNTYLIEDQEHGLTVLDPGPDNLPHVEAVAAAGQGRIRRIIVTHAHGDHYRAAEPLRAATGAPIYASAINAGAKFRPDQVLRDRDIVAGMTAVLTPGHAADHLCFERPDGITFTGDHVMGWASSIVSPPDGDMRAYCDSLELMLGRPADIYLSGHGPLIPNPHAHVRALLDHRVRREHAIARAIARAPATPHSIMLRLYSKIDPMLQQAAERNVIAHLEKMHQEGKVEPAGDKWRWIPGA
jgi:glyoxylase-like metal-dependent hydrolase (beta-lactamase superfamily II)